MSVLGLIGLAVTAFLVGLVVGEIRGWDECAKCERQRRELDAQYEAIRKRGL